MLMIVWLTKVMGMSSREMVFVASGGDVIVDSSESCCGSVEGGSPESGHPSGPPCPSEFPVGVGPASGGGL